MGIAKGTKCFRVPDWLKPAAKEILIDLRKNYPHIDPKELVILADQYSIYQAASAKIDRDNIEASKAMCDVAAKALANIQKIEKTLNKIKPQTKETDEEKPGW